MFPGFAEQLQRYAEVIVRFGVNLRPGQRVLLAEPYELQGVDPAAAPLVAAVERAAGAAGAAAVETIWGDRERWRDAAAGRRTDFLHHLAHAAQRLRQALERREAVVFLLSAQPDLGDGLPAGGVAAVRRWGSQHYAELVPDLMRGATNWTAAPAPTQTWAEIVFSDQPAPEREASLWRAVLAACRADHADPVAAWQERAGELERRRQEMNAARPRVARLHGRGTDLRLALAREHRWCTAFLATADGQRFAPNLPTEEVFTAPHPGSAEGRLRVARPVSYGGVVLEDVELEFRGGTVVRARARRGAEALAAALSTDRGACRLGEVALIDGETPVGRTRRCFRSALLDENALPHVALGDAYSFTAAPAAFSEINHSRLHLDLPVEAEVVLS